MTKEKSFTIAKYFAAIGVAASAMLASAPAEAQFITQPVPVAVQVNRALVIRVDRPLTLGAVVLSAGADSASMTAEQSTTIIPSVGVVVASTTALPVASGQVSLVGEADTDVVVSNLPQSVSLHCSCGNSMEFEPVDNLPGTRVVRLSNPGGGAAGEYAFYIGGDFILHDSLRTGRYSGVVSVSARYF